MSDAILSVSHLKKYFNTPHGTLHAVDDVSFDIERGKTLGVVGESGCGKSTLGRSIIRLIEPTSGEILFDGKKVNEFSKNEMRDARKDMQIVFQDPFSSLDPKKTVAQTIAEPMITNKIVKGSDAVNARVLELMDTVGLARRFENSYPHELDGGRRQRIGIARALALNPKFIVCDEPVSALDVSIQAQILNLLRSLQKELGLTYIFITHDLSVVHYIADDIIVMYLGCIVEKAPAEELFANPVHPYTKGLLSAIPVPEIRRGFKRELLKGELTSPIDPPDECRFAKRCPKRCEACLSKQPSMVEVAPNHFVACSMIGKE